MPDLSRPLLGKQVIVTRPAAQAQPLLEALQGAGAVAVPMPLVEIHEPQDWGPVDRALGRLAQYQWLAFTSVNGVHALLKRLQQLNRSVDDLKTLRLAAIGPGTADTLARYGLHAEVVPEAYRSEELAAALAVRVARQRVLLARADRGRDVLREQLAAVAEVEQVAVYAQIDVPEPDAAALARLRNGDIHYVTVTSSSIAHALARALGAAGRQQVMAGHVKLVSISPVTTAALSEEQLPVAAEAKIYTMAGVLDALIELARAG